MVIVFVDDDKWLLDLYSERLRIEGYTVYAASSGKEAYLLIEQKRPGLVISDVVMPNGDGFDLLQKIRANKSMNDIKVINLTNLSSDRDEEQLRHLGSDGYLIKSNYTPTQFTEKIKSILGL
jgi:DNA-binding response OmpR family regulator